MGFWTSGPVVGSLIVAVVGTATIPVVVNDPRFWTHEYIICGIAGLIVWVITFFLLRELSPALRDQLMVTLRDRALIEAKAKGMSEEDIGAALAHSFSQLLKPDIIISAIAVSLMLLIYYTAVGFAVIYLTTVFGFSVKNANGLGNWNWGFNVIAVIPVGIVSDYFRVRKPFMVLGGVLAAVMTVIYLEQAGHHPGYYTLAIMLALLAFGLGVAYTPWMASYTETVEAQPGTDRHRPGHLGLDHPHRGLRRVPARPGGDQHRHSAGELRRHRVGLRGPVPQSVRLRERAPERRSVGPEGPAVGRGHRVVDPADGAGHRTEDPHDGPGHRAGERHAAGQRAEARAQARGDPGAPGAVRPAGDLHEPGQDPARAAGPGDRCGGRRRQGHRHPDHDLGQ
jgi:hypothetical protein